MTATKEDSLRNFIAEVRASRKYRSLNLPDAILVDIFEKEWDRQNSQREAVKSARQKLHNVVAPYLGDPDYEEAAAKLKEAAREGEMKPACLEILEQHASTRERIPHMGDFYAAIFKLTGLPSTVLDLACGLNPFALPWMGLPKNVRYHAYDIHSPRVRLINQFLELEDRLPLGEVRDVLVSPPEVEADVAFLFKEAHRFEQRRKGCNASLWEALRVRYLLVSLPANNLTGHHSMVERQRGLVYGILEGKSWPVVEICVGGELVFCIEKR